MVRAGSPIDGASGEWHSACCFGVVRPWRLPPLPSLPDGAWQPQRVAATSRPPRHSGAVPKRALPSSELEDEATMAGIFDLRDPKIFRSDRPPAFDLRDAEDDRTDVDFPQQVAASTVSYSAPAGADEEPLTLVYRPPSTQALLPPAGLAADFEPTRVDVPGWSREVPVAQLLATQVPLQEPSPTPFERGAKPRRASRRPKASRRATVLKVAFAACVVGTWALALTLRGDALVAVLLAAWQRWLG
jgi:hypothetical protein